MRRGFLAALVVVLIAASSTWADEEPEGSQRTWLDADYLLWWLKPAPGGPPLLTTGTLTNPTSAGSGVLGAPSTSVLAGNGYFNTGPYSGFRIHGGWIPCGDTWGVDGSFFYLTQMGVQDTFSSNTAGSPLLSRPIVDARTGAESVLFVAAPGAFSGSFIESSSTRFYGFDGNLLLPWYRCYPCDDCEVGYYVTPLAGYRYLNLRDGLVATQASNVLNNGVGFFDGQPIPTGGFVSVTDQINTLNQFYGGQIGVKAGLTWWRFTLNGAAKIALGSMHEEANLNGSTTGFNSSVHLMQTIPGGLYALATNIGAYNRNIIAVVPEGALNFAVEITPQIKAWVGYTILYLSDVARPGNLIDRSINRTELPSSQTFNPAIPGPQHPNFQWSATDFWAQGINIGLVLRF